MSLLPTALYQSPSNLITGISQSLFASTITTNRINLDCNALDTTGSGASASLLINGVTLASASNLSTSIANWSIYPAISTITYATGGGSGGNLIMNTGSISTLNTKNLLVSSINGSDFTATSGVFSAITTGTVVSNQALIQQTLTFGNNNSVPLKAGVWYLVKAQVNITVAPPNTPVSDRWLIQLGLAGGTLGVNPASQVFWAKQVLVYNQNNVNSQFSFSYVNIVKCTSAGSQILLQIVATLPDNIQENAYQWDCSSFVITPLGGQAN